MFIWLFLYARIHLFNLRNQRKFELIKRKDFKKISFFCMLKNTNKIGFSFLNTFIVSAANNNDLMFPQQKKLDIIDNLHVLPNEN